MSGTLGTRTGHRVHAPVVTAEPAHTDALPALAPAPDSGERRRPRPAKGVLDGPHGRWAPGSSRYADSGRPTRLGHGGDRGDGRGGDEFFAVGRRDGRGGDEFFAVDRADGGCGEPITGGRDLVAGTARSTGGRGRGRTPVLRVGRGEGHAIRPVEGGR
ncbi:hypothetical protein [Streptomyces sp. SLBN-31]|uniref:hypothetical protein n=1 Tax=Streptomyces sp. SLBN-31 TaxID=2768444 RepID=UPI0011529ADA|nr:hypothetical protein [Streptomyces sp. SLBN-31]TQJ90607.1 hypothetical protein FBY22_1397 [Streptomyces sp. SLBN-31]